MPTATRSPTTSASSIPQVFGFSRELSITLTASMCGWPPVQGVSLVDTPAVRLRVAARGNADRAPGRNRNHTPQARRCSVAATPGSHESRAAAWAAARGCARAPGHPQATMQAVEADTPCQPSHSRASAVRSHSVLHTAVTIGGGVGASVDCPPFGIVRSTAAACALRRRLSASVINLMRASSQASMDSNLV
jgi:hypothetical protein